ncbi:MAG: hypothetical protein KatS3mg123_0519 [Burkholderiales bacterium]|nr:MAG: hypothetical protein KatS3mg123_0519 [Burkholderiales bacterium]
MLLSVLLEASHVLEPPLLIVTALQASIGVRCVEPDIAADHARHCLLGLQWQ